MKIFAFVDVHGNKKIIDDIIKNVKKNDPDLLICLGDLSEFGQKSEELLEKFRILNKPMLIIPGNHDEYELKKAAKKFDFCIYLHKGAYKVNNIIFFGYGGGGFSFEEPELEFIAKKFKSELKKEDKIIILSHAPVYGTKTDYMDGLGHRGNRSLLKIIKEIKPMLVLCGHFHENAGKTDKVDSTIILNPGPSGKFIEINGNSINF